MHMWNIVWNWFFAFTNKILILWLYLGKKKHFTRRQRQANNRDLSKDSYCRLAGVAFVAPVVNYGWPSLSKKLIKKDYRRRLIKWCFRISKYAPGLLHWWISQKLFPSTTSVLESNQRYFNSSDIEVLKRITGFPMLTKVHPYLLIFIYPHISCLLVRFTWTYSDYCYGYLV